MATIRTYGAEARPSQPSFYIPNRVDETSLPAIVKAMGGAENVAFMVEEVLVPSAKVMKYIRGTGSQVLSFNFRKSNSRELREQLMDLMQLGLDVIFVPGRPNSIIGTISDVPMPFMMQLGALHIAPVPVFVGSFRNNIWRAFTSGQDYDWLTIDFLPKLQSGPQTGERLLEVWLEACYTRYDESPAFEKSLARVLVEGMRKNAKVELIDGLDGSALPYGMMLGVAMALSRWLKKNVKEERLGIILPPGKLCTIANLACIMAGISAVNINYTATQEQFDHMVKQANLTRFITESRFTNKQRNFPWPLTRDLIFLDQELAAKGPWKLKAWSTLSRLRTPQQIMQHAGIAAPSPEQEAAVIFTGGTEDKPMGAPFTQRMLLAATMSLRSRLELSPGHDALMSILPAYTPTGLVAGILLPILGGYNMVTYPTPTAGKRICTLVHEHSAALVANTPSGLRAMFKAAKEPNPFTSLHYCLSAGVKMPPSLAEAARQHFGVEVLECYGTAESLPFAAAAMPAPIGDPETSQPTLPTSCKGCIGAPMPGVAVRITGLYSPEASRQPSNPGLVWLSGPSVAHQYIGSDGNESPRMFGKWFCTGDVGYMTPDGLLCIMGRRVRFTQMGEDMIPHVQLEEYLYKIFNVTPEENERKLAVVSVPSRTGGEELVILSTLHKEVIPSDYLTLRYGVTNLHLPSTWAPKHIIPVKFIPTLPNGKLDYETCFAGACRMLNIKLG